MEVGRPAFGRQVFEYSEPRRSTIGGRGPGAAELARRRRALGLSQARLASRMGAGRGRACLALAWRDREALLDG
jgi:hypothetical protein